MSRPRERRETGEQDLFRARLDQIINMTHELVRLAQTIDWPVLERRFGEVYCDGPGMPPLPTRLMAGLAILKHTFNLSDEELCARWGENPYFQYLCGEEFFRHDLPFDRSSMTRWRGRMGEERLSALLQESLAVAVKTGAMQPSDTRRVIVDTTVQPKNVMFPTDAKRRRSAVEPVIGHLKAEHRMGRNYLAGEHGDAINAVLAAAGYNFSLLLNWLRQLLWLLLAWLLGGANPHAA
ncbi:transposase [Sinorhizobium fredii]|uniref:IS5 family insertion sequence transposase domain-containing protein n=1 Tax=Rhizobium fredii TaxID=380 RepID=A0A2L0HBU2_RHIFR|nr:transposase [Sinorhizobium fredii]AUX78971.1 IS5 family insertion sequence transposase domain-containing protein [Sinorhizobium fredii]